MTRLDGILEQLVELIAEQVAERVADRLASRAAQPGGDLVTLAEFARRRSISGSTVRGAIREGRLAAVKIGRAVRLRADAEIGRRIQPASLPAREPDSPETRAQRIKIDGAL